MPDVDINSKWRALTREAFKTGDLRKLRAEAAKLAEQAPLEYWAATWHRITDDLGNLARFVASAPPDGTPILLAVAVEEFRIAEDAHHASGKTYARYVDESGEMFQ